MFKEEDIERYSRQLVLEEIGPSGQDAICRASVVVIGAGGLGCPTLSYLAGAGFGKITIVDFDRVTISNLHRQFLYTTEDQGKYKAECAAQRLKDLNPTIEINAITTKFSSENGLEILSSCDLAIDCSDSIDLRYLLNDLCVGMNKPFIFGAIHGFEGQFGLMNVNSGSSYEDYFPKNAGWISKEDCNQTGVLGPLCGMVASFQAMLSIQFITGKSAQAEGQLFLLDGKNFDIHIIRSKHKNTIKTRHTMKTIDPVSFYQLDKNFQTIVDVREVGEEPIVNDYDRILIPLAEIPHRMHEIPKDKDVYVICRSGRRSENAIHFLETHGYSNLINVEGGTLGFIEQKNAHQ